CDTRFDVLSVVPEPLEQATATNAGSRAPAKMYRLMRKPPGVSTPLPADLAGSAPAQAHVARAPGAGGLHENCAAARSACSARLLELRFEREVDVLRLAGAHDDGAAQAIVEAPHLEAMATRGQRERVLAAVFAARRV